jgi:hypothetical protein
VIVTTGEDQSGNASSLTFNVIANPDGTTTIVVRNDDSTIIQRVILPKNVPVTDSILRVLRAIFAGRND